MRKIKISLTAVIAFALMALIAASSTWASESEIPDFKEERLRMTLEEYNSPLKGMEDVLIDTAEKYDLDWTLLAAIAGNESAFAKRMPYKCNNPFGWGIYGDNKLCFKSLEHSIIEVGEGLGTKYNTASLQTIARTYNPSNTNHWMSVTQIFMNKIKNQKVPASKLPILL